MRFRIELGICATFLFGACVPIELEVAGSVSDVTSTEGPGDTNAETPSMDGLEIPPGADALIDAVMLKPNGTGFSDIRYVGDLDGDGFDDLVLSVSQMILGESGLMPGGMVGGDRCDPDSVFPMGLADGVVFLVYGGREVDPKTDLMKRADALFVQDSGIGEFGRTLAPLGDINNDGLDDLFIGSGGAQMWPDCEDTGQLVGAYGALLYGRRTRYAGVVNIASVASVLQGPSTQVELVNLGVRGVALGDIDGDGASDWGVYGFGDQTTEVDPTGHGTAVLYLYSGADTSPADTVDLTDAAGAWRAVPASGSSGYLKMLDGMGRFDLNKDGIDDVATSYTPVSDETWSEAQVEIRFGSPDLLSENTPARVPDVRLSCPQSSGIQFNGFAAVDLNLDGDKEVAVSMGCGGLFVLDAEMFVGMQPGVQMDMPLEEASRLVPGSVCAASDAYGMTVSVGDVDGDGREDLMQLRLGRPVSTLSYYRAVPGWAPWNGIGGLENKLTDGENWGLASPAAADGDLDGDGAPDLVISMGYGGLEPEFLNDLTDNGRFSSDLEPELLYLAPMAGVYFGAQ